MQKVRARLIFLSRLLTRRMIYKLKQFDDSLELIYSFTPTEISNYFSISMQRAITIHANLRQSTIVRLIERDEQMTQIVTIYDKQYPAQLKAIHDAPLVLYALGDLKLLNDAPSISVIGTRKPSNGALQKLNYIVTPLIKNKWTIVSGLAYGVDSMAHTLTVNQSGKTIAVLGSGFNNIYPKQNIHLFKRIVKTGLVITEYPPNIPPRRFHFPERNRIISGLTDATLVIEAKERSGTLITVDQALDQGREVYAVPGSPLVAQTVGCHKLIQDGAKLVMCADDILEDWE